MMVRAKGREDIEGVSGTTLTVLLILTLFVSAIGVWSVLQDTDSSSAQGDGLRDAQRGARAPASATSSLPRIANPKETGLVTLNVSGDGYE